MRMELSRLSKIEKCKAMRDIIKGTKEYKKVGGKYSVIDKSQKIEGGGKKNGSYRAST